jgi:hypothetical protein
VKLPHLCFQSPSFIARNVELAQFNQNFSDSLTDFGDPFPQPLAAVGSSLLGHSRDAPF